MVDSTSFSRRTQKLRTVYTMLSHLSKESIDPDRTIHRILTDIKNVVDDLHGRTGEK